MRQRTREAINFLIMVALVLMTITIAVVARAQGDHHCQGNACNDGGGDTIVNTDSVLETIVKTDSLGIGLAFSYGMGDVDINEGRNCMGSEQKANIIWGSQAMALNPWCASLFYELNDRHDFAAKMRCDIDEILNKYTSLEECWKDQELAPIIVDHDVHLRSEEFEAAHAQQEEEIVYLKEEQASLVGRIDYLTERIERAPQQQVQQIDYGAERRAKSREAYQKALAEGTEKDES